MNFDLAASIAVLERTPPALRAMLHGLPLAWTDATEGPDTWSPVRDHLAQTARVMAKQYREAVGPWRAYLPVMDR